jgi:hypothetical protein
LVLWIRRAVPEPETWLAAKCRTQDNEPRFSDLFRGAVCRTTVVVVIVCATSLTAHWAFMYWSIQHLRNLPEVVTWSEADKSWLAGVGLALVMVTSIVGNFLAGAIASRIGYRPAIIALFLAYFGAMCVGYGEVRELRELWIWLGAVGTCQGVFALFTMYLPPLFPTLLRTTGAGFCYNIGRLAAAAGTVYFGSYSHAGDHRLALFYASFLFLPAAASALLLPELSDVSSTS